MMTWADSMKEEGRQLGLKEGLQQGLKDGRQQGLQDGLDALQNLALSILEERFTRVPEKMIRSIKNIQSMNRLSEVVRRAAVADSLADVGV